MIKKSAEWESGNKAHWELTQAAWEEWQRLVKEHKALGFTGHQRTQVSQGRRAIYGIAEIEVGERKTYPAPEGTPVSVMAHRIQRCCRYWALKLGRDYSTHMTNKGVRITRVV